MKTFLSTIKYDYLQRTRSYSFLITLCVSLAIAYTFVPEPNATYSTIRIANHVGCYNAAWFGYVTAIMTSIFLSLVGFYLINNSINKDEITKIGQITASTPISNFKYLTSKVLSNFLVLSTIVLIVAVMSVILFFLYNEGYPFEVSQFLIPYLLIPIPAMFFIAVLAVVFEVFFKNYSIIQNIVFFFLFSAIAFNTSTNEAQYAFDPFGTKIVMHQLEASVRSILQTDEQTSLNIGYVIGNIKDTKKFEFNGVSFPLSFITSRVAWCLLGITLIGFISPFFHRFNTKERSRGINSIPKVFQKLRDKEITLSSLEKSKIDYGVFSLVKTELIMLFRKGKKWLWVINLIGFVLLAITPISIAYPLILPILWFFQVHRLSEISSKEAYYNVHYFAFTSYRPLRRLLASQLIAGIIMLLLLALPLLVRLAITPDILSMIHIIIGSIFIVLMASTLGILTKGKKLFEVLFFMITYANINKIPFTDYFGGLIHSSNYLLSLIVITVTIGIIGFLTRRHQLRN
ncbi:ABC transporter permease [uncultured Aquimarina sp.]|uniref:ABC transporter permease n=1 Tax=uncultured Aquimarina sp. TaxID=575652 RepID=UPI00262A2E81|nr:ABC transporter permease [uncultured Aquimarina sp.]